MTGRDQDIEALMRKALEGDRRAYAACLQLLVPRMRGMASRDLPAQHAHLAEDVVQEALLSIHLKRGSWDPERPLLPWVRVIVKHKAIDALRKTPNAPHDPSRTTWSWMPLRWTRWRACISSRRWRGFRPGTPRLSGNTRSGAPTPRRFRRISISAPARCASHFTGP